MTSPQQTATSDQILIKLGEMSAQLAVVVEKLNALPDHEIRLRALQDAMPPKLEERLSSLETARARIFGLSALIAIVSSAGGTWIGLIIAHH